MYKGKIPFHKKTGRLEYEPYSKMALWKDEFDWVDNYSFSVELRIKDVVNAYNSTKNLTAIVNNQEVTMFVKDFVQAIIKYGADRGGKIRGDWCYCKRGKHFGICAFNE